MAVIKTGVILRKRNEPTIGFLSDEDAGLSTVYGDLHLVGDSAILYYPKNQLEHGVSHGWIDLDMGMNMWLRNTSPYHVLVIPANRIILRRAVIWPTDVPLWKRSGGHIDDTPGDMG